MGEAKRRAEAFAAAQPYRPPRVCPSCKSIRIEHVSAPPTALSHRPTDYDVCRACGTVWEAYPDNWCEDVVGAEPCDNCAFRPDSPEQKSPEQWRELVAKLRAGGEFYCHKGAPILGLTHAKKTSDGNYEVEFDADWIRRRGRKCAGFMRMVWAMSAKGEDWFSRRYGLPESAGEPE